MKTKLAFIMAVVGTMVSVEAATLVFTNSNGVDTNAITSSTGVAYQGAAATFQVGYFSITDAQITGAANAATLTSSFVQFGGPTSFSTFTAAGVPSANNRGFTTLNAPATTITGSSFANKNMYMFVIGASNSEFGVFKSNLIFDPADDPVLPNVTKLFTSVNTPNANILFGGTSFSVPTSNTDTVTSQSWNTKSFTAAPEPSAVLLGAIGVFGLLRRRRN